MRFTANQFKKIFTPKIAKQVNSPGDSPTVISLRSLPSVISPPVISPLRFMLCVVRILYG